MAYKINTDRCIKCGECVDKCPEKAIFDIPQKDPDGTVIHNTKIDPRKCTNCGVCVSVDYWCPAQAIIKA